MDGCGCRRCRSPSPEAATVRAASNHRRRPVAAAALLYRQLARSGLAAEPLPGLLLLAGLWAGAWLAGLWLHRRSCRAAGGHHAALLALAAAGWTAAASAVLLLVRARITGPSPTADARGLFYRDAWKLAAEAPWLGRGGETWRHMYLAAQSRPYVGSQVHSGYLDILLNLGMAGLAAVLLLLLAAGALVFKASPRLLPPLLVIILHSAADFDWSYGLVWLLLLLLPAWAMAEANSRTARTSVPLALRNSLYRIQPIGRPKPKKRPRRLWVYAGITVVCGLTLLYSSLSFQAMKGAALFKQAVRENDPAARIILLKQSMRWNPREPQTAVALSRLLPQKQGLICSCEACHSLRGMLLCMGSLRQIICGAVILEKRCTGSAAVNRRIILMLPEGLLH